MQVELDLLVFYAIKYLPTALLSHSWEVMQIIYVSRDEARMTNKFKSDPNLKIYYHTHP